VFTKQLGSSCIFCSSRLGKRDLVMKLKTIASLIFTVWRLSRRYPATGSRCISITKPTPWHRIFVEKLIIPHLFKKLLVNP
jgi:hypothetical protein